MLIGWYRRTIGYYYPFIQFLTVVAFPMAYWIATVELCTFGTQDNTFSLSFGQVCFYARNTSGKLTSSRSSRCLLPSPQSFRWCSSLENYGTGSGDSVGS